MAGLNPHCEPIFGDEETRVVAPVVAEARAKGWNVHGPIPADTIFLRAKKGEFDAVVALYHDQARLEIQPFLSSPPFQALRNVD